VICITGLRLLVSDPRGIPLSLRTPGRKEVPLFRRRVDYDRKWLVAEAERAIAKRRIRRSIALYRRVMAAEPRNAALHARIAPLLAQTRQDFDAWESFRRAARARISNKQPEEALVLYREAARCLPRQIEAWQSIARLETQLGRRERAREALLKGRRQFRSRRHRPQAIALLRAAREIEPWGFDPVLDLARLLARSRQALEAQWLLGQLAERSSGRRLRRVRGLQWRIEPSCRHSWYWLCAAVAGLKARSPAPA
jgi:tetratricopeptide (TPR) repeat protein